MNNSEILIYQNQDGNIKIDVRLEEELDARATVRKFRTVQMEGNRNVEREVDYNPKDEKTITFFKVIQNKLLWAISQQTAAELVYRRADGSAKHPHVYEGLDSTIGCYFAIEKEQSLKEIEEDIKKLGKPKK